MGIKPSSLVKERAGALKTVTVYLGSAKKSIETTLAEAPAKVVKQGKAGTQAATNGDPYTAPLADQQFPVSGGAVRMAAKPVPAANSAVLPPPSPSVASTLQTATIPPSGVFAPPVTEAGHLTHTIPGTANVHNPFLNFAPSAAEAAPAPHIVSRDAKPNRTLTNVPLPRPRPKPATATTAAAVKRTAPAQ
jgi:hypothetical protein